MNIKIHKSNGKTTSELLDGFTEVKAKDVMITSLNETFISVSLKNPKTGKQLLKKEIESFIDAGWKLTEIAPNKSILVYNGK